MIYAFDPGKMTGWAKLVPSSKHFVSGQLPWFDCLHWLHETLKMGSDMVDAVVCEDFIYTNQTAKKSRQTWSTEGIGALRFMTQEYQIPFELQSPSSAKRFSTDTKLKRIGWYVPGQDHANDAARHLLVYAVSNGLAPVEWFRTEED